MRVLEKIRALRREQHEIRDARRREEFARDNPELLEFFAMTPEQRKIAAAKGEQANRERFYGIEDWLVQLAVGQHERMGWTVDGAGPDWATMHKRKGVEAGFTLARIAYEVATANKIMYVEITAGGTVTRTDQHGVSYR